MEEHKADFPNLISRRQYNDRRKFTANLCEQIRKNIAQAIDGDEDVFCIDSKSIPVCRIARANRCKLGKNDFATAPSKGYCASQGVYYYGYKLHAVCGVRGVLHSYDLSKASVHDIHYLQDVRHIYRDCTIIGDKGYPKARKRIETLFSQLDDQFMACRNYAKQQVGLFTRIISKISAITVLQYINFINNKPIGRIKYALI